jgi:hypothetical protein
MVKQLLTSVGIVFLFLLFSVYVYASDPPINQYSFSMDIGPAHNLNDVPGITNLSKSYVDKLTMGTSYNLQLFYRHLMFTAGFLYSGYLSQGKLEYSTDKIFLNYLAPQIGLQFLTTNKVNLRATMGVGSILYLNNSTVYGKKRKVTSNTLAGNIALNGVYHFSPELGLSLNLQYLSSEFNKLNIKYHGETLVVKNYLSGLGAWEQLSVSVGLSYFFYK